MKSRLSHEKRALDEKQYLAGAVLLGLGLLFGSCMCLVDGPWPEPGEQKVSGGKYLGTPV